MTCDLCNLEKKRSLNGFRKKVICKNCEIVFKVHPCRDRKFCSTICANQFYNKIKHNERTIEKICKICSKKFLITRCRNNKYNTQFCSWKCRTKGIGEIMKGKAAGEKHPFWKGTRVKRRRWFNRKICLLWSKTVRERDNYTCQICGSKNHTLAHHIKNWENYPELRFNVDNGITYCLSCHSKYHRRIQNGKEMSIMPTP